MTVNDIFEHTMSLIDERLESGLVDTTSTVIFQKNTPFLLTILQNEVIQDSDYTKTETITVSSAVDTAGHYIAHTMPSDFKNETQVISIETGDTYQRASDFKWEGSNILLIPDTFIGTIKVVYTPIPDALTSMSDTLVVDNIICTTVLTYGLASRLLTNENKTLASFFNDLYTEAKNKPKKRKLATAETIKDYYDSKMSY